MESLTNASVPRKKTVQRFSIQRIRVAAGKGDLGALRSELAYKTTPANFQEALDEGLVHAAMGGQTAIAMYLLDCGANMARDHWSIISTVVGAGHPETLAALIERGAQVTKCAHAGLLLLLAMRHDNVKLVELLMNAGLFGEEPDLFPLQAAISAGCANLASWLAERCASRLDELTPDQREALAELLKKAKLKKAKLSKKTA
jgi:hypothetical protein